MVQTKVKVPEAASKPEPKNIIGKTAHLSEDVLKSLEAGQRAALDAVRKFVDTVDEILPAMDGHPSRGEKVVDAALEMADRLVTTQYEFLRNVVHSADRTVAGRTAPKG